MHIYKLSIWYKWLWHIENSILLYKKEGNNGPNIVHFWPMHNAVSRLAPRRSAPMHNIGAITAVMAVRADALLKDTDGTDAPAAEADGTGETDWIPVPSVPSWFR